MLRAWLSVLVVAVVLAGCSAHPQESFSGPSHLVSVKNFGPKDVKVTLTTTLPNGTVERDSFAVKANQTVEKRQTTVYNASIQATLEYTWDNGGKAATGVFDLSYDGHLCSTGYRFDVELYTIPDQTAGRVTPGCQT